MDLSSYERVLGFNSVGEGFIKDTELIINNEFKNSPSYKRIKINDVDEDCQLKTTKDFNVFKIFLRPRKKVFFGNYVLMDDKTYLVTNCTINEIYPKAEITLCNNTLKWKDDSDKIVEYKCAVSGKVLEVDDTKSLINNKFAPISDAELVVKVPYNDDTKKISVNNKFIFDGSAFEVVGIDRLTEVYDDQGVIKLTIRAVSTVVNPPSEEEEEIKEIYDDSNNSGWGEW